MTNQDHAPASATVTQSTARAIGADIKALRMMNDFSIQQLSSRIGRSAGWLSQVERGASAIAVSDLRTISGVCGVDVSLFFGPHEETVQNESERGLIVRRGSRRTLGSKHDGYFEELLSPSDNGALQVILSSLHAGAETSLQTERSGHEMILAIAGKFDLRVDGMDYTLSAGDTFALDGRPFTCLNLYKDMAQFHWIISPAFY